MADQTDDQKTIAALQTQVATLTEAKTKAEADLATASQVIAELKQKLSDKSAGTLELPTVKVGKDTYELVTDFFWKGSEVSIDVLKENSALAEELVKEGVQTLRKLATKKA